ncbi:MAG: hypothetical protein WCF36_02645 [Candidatus Nanopelagicales bacterium]
MNTDLTHALDAYRAQLDSTPEGATPRRWRFGVLMALAVAVLVGGALTTLRPGGPPTPEVASEVVGVAPPAPTTTPPAPAPTIAGAATVASPPPAGWSPWSSPVLSTWLPEVPGAGPTDPDRVAGFARTEFGALAAAATLHPLIYR